MGKGLRGANMQDLEGELDRCMVRQTKLGREWHDLFCFVYSFRVMLLHPLLELPPLRTIGLHQRVKPFRGSANKEIVCICLWAGGLAHEENAEAPMRWDCIWGE